MPNGKVAFVAAETDDAQAALESLEERFGNHPPSEATVIVALGGDGFMLETLHAYLNTKARIYGMNRGTVGFLLNAYHEDSLMERLARAEKVKLHPLRMVAYKMNGVEIEALAFNEASILRETRQAAKLRVLVDGKVRLEQLICDGAMVATPAGSTAYNLSAHGPILPIDANLLALTPISAFRPRRWHGALLGDDVCIGFEVIDPDKRPVSAVADFTEVRDVRSVKVSIDRTQSVTLLFDPEHNLEERILLEQFQP